MTILQDAESLLRVITYDLRSRYPYTLVGPRALLPPMPPRPTHPYRTAYDWTAYVCVFWDFNREGWRGVPELVPLRCRIIKREGLAWGLRCFMDHEHEGPCHF